MIWHVTLAIHGWLLLLLYYFVPSLKIFSQLEIAQHLSMLITAMFVYTVLLVNDQLIKILFIFKWQDLSIL